MGSKVEVGIIMSDKAVLQPTLNRFPWADLAAVAHWP